MVFSNVTQNQPLVQAFGGGTLSTPHRIITKGAASPAGGEYVEPLTTCLHAGIGHQTDHFLNLLDHEPGIVEGILGYLDVHGLASVTSTCRALRAFERERDLLARRDLQALILANYIRFELILQSDDGATCEVPMRFGSEDFSFDSYDNWEGTPVDWSATPEQLTAELFVVKPRQRARLMSFRSHNFDTNMDGWPPCEQHQYELAVPAAWTAALSSWHKLVRGASVDTEMELGFHTEMQLGFLRADPYDTTSRWTAVWLVTFLYCAYDDDGPDELDDSQPLYTVLASQELVWE
jgi:hypothetical protein